MTGHANSAKERTLAYQKDEQELSALKTFGFAFLWFITTGLVMAVFILGRDSLSELRMLAILALALVLWGCGYFIWVSRVEQRKVSELATKFLARELGGGLLLGGGLVLLVVGSLLLVTESSIGPSENPGFLLALCVSVWAAFSEEVLFRPLLQKRLADWKGSQLALWSTALLFGFLHLANPHANLVGFVAVTMAGLLMGQLWQASQRLWLVMGTHAGWNFAVGGIFGLAISGIEVRGLLEVQVKGNELFTGGDFGPEASVLAILFLGLANLIIHLRFGRPTG